MPKRRRTEEPAAQEDTPMDTTPRPSKKVWFEDGNIILQAGNLQFKVHRGVLAKQSPVFADLFQIPHPPGEPTVEGCPVVELHDEAEDLEHALLALYGDASHVGTKDKPNLSALAAMIRLGRKYEISYLRDEGLARLKREFPTTLEEYDRLPEEYLSFTYPETQCGLDPIVDIIKLAHECNIQSILPALYLQATSWKLDELLYRPDCSSIPFRALCNIISGRDELLNARKDLERCVLFGQGIQAQWLRGAPEPLLALQTWTDCLESVEKMLKHVSIDIVRKGALDHMRLCRACLLKAQEAHNRVRKDVWDELPGYFKLPGWGELKDFQE
ncbi:hypothetical protein FA13DRAFT_1736503 [Coprinellus micaceus]|uniref:BTB domain-containing protein n=1 Tax=Coprinellus micaceus TaxID=71717 RepID=A0A4Y7T0E1_COPMI|nr:hypothetical protein FA13DRAFT_1736503 [Coprinellus micaceus]